MGLTSRGVDTLGELESVDLPNEGSSFDEGDVLAEVQGDSGAIEILAPFSLEVVEVNESAGGNLDQIAEDPLEEGWLVKIRDRKKNS
jgi:glycine cleavage system H protein